MAKKKSKPQKTSFNPISYLKSGNARKLPVYKKVKSGEVSKEEFLDMMLGE